MKYSPFLFKPSETLSQFLIEIKGNAQNLFLSPYTNCVRFVPIIKSTHEKRYILDYLEKEVEEDTLVQEERQKATSFLTLIKPIKGSEGFHSIQRDKIIQILKKLSSAVKHYRANYSSKNIDEEGEMIIQENVSCEIEATKANLRNLLKDAYTIYLTLSKLWKDKKKDLYFYFLYFLLEDKNQTFLSMYPEGEEKIKLVEDEKNGNIQLYDFCYFVDKN